MSTSAPRHPGADRVDPGLLGLADDVVDLPQLGGRGAERDRPGHVGVVALDARAEVELDDVALLEHAVPRVVVRLGGVLPERDDRIEGEVVAPLLEQQALQVARQVSLAHPHAHDVEDAVERPVGGGLRTPEQVELLSVLDPAPTLHDVGERDERDAIAQGRAQLRVVVDGDRLRLEPEARHAREEPREVVADGPPVGDAIGAGDLVPRLLRVAAVGEEGGAVGRDQQLAVRPGEPGQVPDVDELGDEHRIGAERLQLIPDRSSPQFVIHGIASSAR